MARIYYHEEKLCGESISSKHITVELFDFIFNHTNTDKFVLQNLKKSSKFGLAKPKAVTFKNVQLTRDGIHYKTSEGAFFLPSSMIFYDIFDYNFPSEFYFIAKIGNRIELRQCNGGKDTKWYEIPELHKPVTDSKILQKIEKTLSAVKKLVETKYNKQNDRARKKNDLNGKAVVKKSHSLLNNLQKKGYQELTELCVYDNSHKDKILKFIEVLKNYDKDSEYFTTLNYFIHFMEETQFNFIMRMDWKAGVEDLEWLLQRNLKDNYHLNINLPKPENYAESRSISDNNVFRDFARPIEENGLQLGFIDSRSDEYLAVLHKIQDKEKVERAVNKIGYDYYEK